MQISHVHGARLMGPVHHPFVGHVLRSSVDAVRQPSNHIPGPARSNRDRRPVSERAPPANPPKQSERPPRGSPDDRVAKAQARVIRLQAAVDLLGEDNPDTASLKTMLVEAKAQTRVAPVGERIGCMLEEHRVCEKASRECRARCDQGTGDQSFSRDRVVRGAGEFAMVAFGSHVYCTSSSS